MAIFEKYLVIQNNKHFLATGSADLTQLESDVIVYGLRSFSYPDQRREKFIGYTLYPCSIQGDRSTDFHTYIRIVMDLTNERNLTHWVKTDSGWRFYDPFVVEISYKGIAVEKKIMIITYRGENQKPLLYFQSSFFNFLESEFNLLLKSFHTNVKFSGYKDAMNIFSLISTKEQITPESEKKQKNKTTKPDSIKSPEKRKLRSGKSSTHNKHEINLIGLSDVKSEITKIIDVVKVRNMRKTRGLIVSPSTLHMVFSGNPGTGKTTVARIIADAFKEIGVLSKGHLVEVDRTGLVEKYVGHTAKKVEEVVNAALGGVLFIDEAYSLAGRGQNDFGIEVIDTLVKLMEDKREEFVLIIAGYKDKMEELLDSNEGFRSRFYKTIHFPDYSLNELCEIFKHIASNKGYKLSDGVVDKVREIIEKEKNLNETSFGNARGVRKIFERIEMQQATRLAKLKKPSNNQLMTILSKDIEGSED